MSFWKSASKATPSEPDPPAAATVTTSADLSEKPLPNIYEKPLPDPTITVVTPAQPLKRPGTSSTELVLTSNRRAASQTFQAARRAERSYKAGKRAAAARTAYASAKTHFGAAAHHLKVGVKLTFEVAASVPYIVEDKRERRRAAAGEARAQKVLLAKEKAAVADSPKQSEEEQTAETTEDIEVPTQEQAENEGQDGTPK